MKTSPVFQFKTSMVNKKPDASTYPKQIKDDKQEVITMIQGRLPGSVQEWRVSQALNKFGLKYIYQYSVNGGRMPGGQIIDFMVYTVPLPTPVYVQGLYWHRNEKSFGDRLKQINVRSLFKGQINMPVLLWEDKLTSVDAAASEVKKNIL